MFDTILKILLDLILDNYKGNENKIAQLSKAVGNKAPKKKPYTIETSNLICQ